MVKAEGRPSSSITEQLRLGSHMVPTSAMPRVSQVEAPHRSWTKTDTLGTSETSLELEKKVCNYLLNQQLNYHFLWSCVPGSVVVKTT